MNKKIRKIIKDIKEMPVLIQDLIKNGQIQIIIADDYNNSTDVTKKVVNKLNKDKKLYLDGKNLSLENKCDSCEEKNNCNFYKEKNK